MLIDYRHNNRNKTINVKMTTDEEKSKIQKLLQGLEVAEEKLTERCSHIVKEFHKKFAKEVEEEAREEENYEPHANPYKVDSELMEENERKLKELLAEGKRAKKAIMNEVVATDADPKRPWRTHTNKEKLLRIDNELKRHNEKASQLIVPMPEGDMKNLVAECREETETRPPVRPDRLLETVEAAKKNLPNFQYRKIENSTATAITIGQDIDINNMPYIETE